jgi:aromatic ring-opening dioxygenase LigB subunit
VTGVTRQVVKRAVITLSADAGHRRNSGSGGYNNQSVYFLGDLWLRSRNRFLK